MERGIEQYLIVVIVMLVALADLLRGWFKRRGGKNDPTEFELPSEFEVPMEFEGPLTLEVPSEPVPRASSIPPRGKPPQQGGRRGVRQPTAGVAKPAVAPLIGSRSDLRRSIVLREVLGPPKGLE